ncbi:hypothetical protein ACFQ1S_40890, partial [Kibdelosporangium lantanae]
GVAVLRTPPAPVTPEAAFETPDPAPLQTTIHTEYDSGRVLGLISWRSARVTITAVGSTATAYVIEFPSTPTDQDASAPTSCAGFVTSETNNGDGPNDPVLTVTASHTRDGAVVQVQRPGSSPKAITVPLAICNDLPPAAPTSPR